jgi:hypothetical protein
MREFENSRSNDNQIVETLNVCIERLHLTRSIEL